MNKWTLIGCVVAIPIIAFAYYAISPLFITLEGSDALPKSAEMDTSIAVPVVDTPAHPASGTVRIIQADGKTYVRYEDYETINGPDIFVYLAKDLDANEFVNLGRVKATVGSANYEVPAGVDITQYRYVLTWCKAFGVLFNYADISTTL
jgi:hypothetical protein